MGQRTRLVFGSLAGAAAIHLVLVACSGGSSIVGTRDGGSLADVADAVASGDLGAVVDAAVDAVTGLGDAEVRDAHAGDNCQCIRPAETTFSFTLNRGRGEESPVARFSYASLSLSPTLGPDGITGPAALYVTAVASGFLGDGTRVYLSCFGIADRSGRFVGGVPGTTSNAGCSVQLIPAGASTSLTVNTPTVTGLSLPVVSNERGELRAASITGALSGDAGTLTVSNLVVRHSVPGGRLLEEPPPAYRP